MVAKKREEDFFAPGDDLSQAAGSRNFHAKQVGAARELERPSPGKDGEHSNSIILFFGTFADPGPFLQETHDESGRRRPRVCSQATGVEKPTQQTGKVPHVLTCPERNPPRRNPATPSSRHVNIELRRLTLLTKTHQIPLIRSKERSEPSPPPLTPPPAASALKCRNGLWSRIRLRGGKAVGWSLGIFNGRMLRAIEIASGSGDWEWEGKKRAHVETWYPGSGRGNDAVGPVSELNWKCLTYESG